jgi:hypothetical protein
VQQLLCYRIVEESKISLFPSHLSFLSQIPVLLVAPCEALEDIASMLATAARTLTKRLIALPPFPAPTTGALARKVTKLR